MNLPSAPRTLLLFLLALLAWLPAGAIAHGGAHGIRPTAAAQTDVAALASGRQAARASVSSQEYRSFARSVLSSPSHCPSSAACSCAGAACITNTTLAAPASGELLVLRPPESRVAPLALDTPLCGTVLRLATPPRAPPLSSLA